MEIFDCFFYVPEWMGRLMPARDEVVPKSEVDEISPLSLPSGSGWAHQFASLPLVNGAKQGRRTGDISGGPAGAIFSRFLNVLRRLLPIAILISAIAAADEPVVAPPPSPDAKPTLSTAQGLCAELSRLDIKPYYGDPSIGSIKGRLNHWRFDEEARRAELKASCALVEGLGNVAKALSTAESDRQGSLFLRDLMVIGSNENAARKISDQLAKLQPDNKGRSPQGLSTKDLESELKALGGTLSSIDAAEKANKDAIQRLSGIVDRTAASDRVGDVQPVLRQIRADADLARLYPDAERIGYAILLVPDPRVPRHRRSYDLTIDAVIRAMVAQEFMLDRHVFPWQKYLDGGDHGSSNEKSESYQDSDDIAFGRYSKDDGFGLLVFRSDRWRKQSGSYDLIAFYVVAETATFGVQKKAFRDALTKIWERNDSNTNAPLEYAIAAPVPIPSSRDDRQQTPPGGPVFVAGPNFSGSVNSLVAGDAEAARRYLASHVPATTVENLRKEHQNMENAIDSEDSFSLSRDRVAGRCAVVAPVQKFVSGAPLQCTFRREALIFAQGRDDKTLAPWLGALRNSIVCNDPDCACGKYCAKSPGACMETGRMLDEDGHLHHGQGDQCACGDCLPYPAAMHAISTSTTVVTNKLVENNWGTLLPDASPRAIEIDSIAVTDDAKLKWLADLVSAGFANVVSKESNGRRIIILSEASTFGSGICGSQRSNDGFCEYADKIVFSPNIAGLRYSARQYRSTQEKTITDALRITPTGQPSLLTEGAENGSEFPESQQSPITLAGSDAELNRLLDEVRRRDPVMVVVAATDVRDRLFLFELLRDAAPSAQLVDMETDVLTAHSDYARSSRGAITLGSAPLIVEVSKKAENGLNNAIQIASFATDRQVLLYCLLLRITGGGKAADCQGVSRKLAHEPIWHWPDPSKESTVVPFVSTQAGLLSLLPMGNKVFDIADEVKLFWWIFLFVAVGFFSFVAGSAAGRPNIISAFIVGPLIVSLVYVDRLIGYESNYNSLSEFPPRSGVSVFAIFAISILMFSAIAWLCGQIRAIHGGIVPARWYVRLDLMNSIPGSSAVSVNPNFSVITLVVSMLMVVFVALEMNRVKNSLLGYQFELYFLVLQSLFLMIAAAGLCYSGAWLTATIRVSRRLDILVRRTLGEDKAIPDWCRLSPFGDTGNAPAWIYPRFTFTPLLANPECCDASIEYLAAARGVDRGDLVSDMWKGLRFGFDDGLAVRSVLAGVLASMVSVVRWAMACSMLASVALIGIGYAYPASSRGLFLLLALACLIGNALLFVYALFLLERDGIASRLLSNTGARTRFSLALAASALAPFVLVALSLLIIEKPGVVDWSGGLLGPLLSFFTNWGH